MNLWINRGGTTVPVDVSKVEETKHATYVCDTTLLTKNGYWADDPVQLYYVKTPERPEYSNYFGIFVRGDDVYITNGVSATQTPFGALMLPSGEIIFSRYTHDFRYALTDSSAFVDGGRHYLRCAAVGTPIEICIRDGQFFRADNLEEPIPVGPIL